jgi:hypothetical protein
MRQADRVVVATTLAALFATGCSSTIERVEQVAQADQVGVYEAGPPGSRPYSVVRRLGIEPWGSAFDVPHYASAEAGVAALRNQAVALGGNAIVNFGCYLLRPGSKPDIICNGTVIKFAD